MVRRAQKNLDELDISLAIYICLMTAKTWIGFATISMPHHLKV